MKEPILVVVGERVRDIRKKRGLSQEELGEKAGFHFSYIGGLERAEKNITLLNLEKIANALEVHVFDLVNYSEYLQVEQNEKDKLLNELIINMVSMKVSDLNKVKLLISQLFNK